MLVGTLPIPTCSLHTFNQVIAVTPINLTFQVIFDVGDEALLYTLS